MVNDKQPAPLNYKGVMVSSTFTDLQQHRAALTKALNGQELKPVAMENDSAKPDVDVIMRLEACRSVSVKCIWEIPIKENCLMSNTKTMIAVLVALFGALMLGLMAGCMNKADKEPLSAKVTVLAEDKPSTVYSGTVTDLDGNAIKGAKLHILRHRGIKTVSGQQGGYEMYWDASGVPKSHDIYIIARHEEKNLAAATKVGPDTQTQNMTLLPAVTANGTVTDLDGNPIENATVYFGFTAAKGYITSFAERDRFATDSRGIYKVPFIPPKNRYLVSFNAEGYGSRRISVNTDDAVDGVLELGAAALSKADQAISGVVVDTDGNPVPNVQIFRKSTGQPSGYKKTDADGRFTIAVCKGNVVLSAVVNKDGTMLVGRAEAASGTEDVKIVLEPR